MPQKIVIAVGLAAQPIGLAGGAWYYLSWVLGFRDLGWDVWMVEDIPAGACVTPDWKSSPPESSVNRAYWDELVLRHSLAGRATLLVDGDAPDRDDLRDFAAEADVFLNISGHFKSGAVSFPRAVKIYLDGDPAFTQIWAETYDCNMNFEGHDAFFTVGQRLGKPDTFAPTCGITWLPVLPPVYLPQWPVEWQDRFDRFTTLAHLGYAGVEWSGSWFHGKAEEFLRFVNVPREVPAPVELATHLRSIESDLEDFRKAGWRLLDSAIPCASLDTFEDYVRKSSAEFSAAKGGYVVSRTGWFSDRTVCYLASGRPCVVEDTGLDGTFPLGGGLHTFRTPEEAVACCRRVIEDFPAQQRAARRLAEEHLATTIVIPGLLNQV